MFANFAQLAGGKAAAGIVSAVYLLILTRALGAHGYGLLTLVNGYATLIGTLVAYCSFHGVVRYGALALEAGDTARFARIVRFMTVVELVCGATAIGLAAVLAPLVGPHLGWSPDTVRFSILYSLAILCQIRATPQGVLQIAQRFDLISAQQVAMPAARLIGAAGVFLCHGGLIAYLWVWLAASIVEGLAMWVLAAGSWRRLAGGQRLVGPWRGVTREIGGFGRFAVTTKVENTLREISPKVAPLVVGWVLGPTAAGVYALALRGTSLLEKPAGMLGRAIYPVLTAHNARREGGSLSTTVWRSLVVATVSALPIVGLLAAFGPKLLPFIGGKTFQAGGALLILIAVSRLGVLMQAPVAAGLTALGKPGRAMAVAVAAQVAALPLLPVMMRWLGVEGAGWHAAATSLAATAALALFFARGAREQGPKSEEAGPPVQTRPLDTVQA